MKKISILFIFFIAICFDTKAQNKELSKRLIGKTTLAEIMKVVEVFYKEEKVETAKNLSDHEEEFEDEYLHWKRWEYYMSRRLGPNKEFVNIPKLTYEAVKNIDNNTNVPDATNAAYGAWSFIGPTTSSYPNGTPVSSFRGLGRVDRIAFHPTNGNIIYAGTPAGGLWQTTDGGLTWTAISKFLPSLGVSGIVVSNSNPNILYVLTGDGNTYLSPYYLPGPSYGQSIGVLKSIDGGNSWQPTGPLAADPYYGFKLVQDPNNNNILYAATNKGLYKTINGGNVWTIVPQIGNRKVTDIEFKPGNSNVIYASGDRFFAYSPNGGTNFYSSTFSHSIDTSGRIEIAVTPANPSLVYLLAGRVLSSTTFSGIYKSTNSGVNFTRVTQTPNILQNESGRGTRGADQSYYDLGITASPTDANKIATCALVVWRSSNGGIKLDSATDYVEVTTTMDRYIHPDVHDIQYNNLNGFLYAATDGGFFRSLDDGVTWIDYSEGIKTTQFYHAKGFSGNANLLLGGTQDNGVKYRSGYTTDFTHISGADGFDAMFDYSNSNKAYSSINTGVYRYDNLATNTTTDISPPNPRQQFFARLAMNPTTTSNIYAGFDSVFRSTSSGNAGTWVNLGATGNWAIITCPSNATRVYSAGANSTFPNGALFRSDNSGTNWVDTLSNNPGFPPNFPTITGIAVSPSSSLQVWVTFGGYTADAKVIYSSNAGATWTDWTGTLPNLPVNCVQVTGSEVYIGTDIGVYYRNTFMTDWTPFYNGLPRVPVTDLIINSTGGSIIAATFGRGAWQSQLHSACVADITVSSALSGAIFYAALNSITSTSLTSGGFGTNVFFKAGNYVTLSPGFRASSGDYFRAFIGPCDAGGIPTSVIRNDSSKSFDIAASVLATSKTSLYNYSKIIKINKNKATADVEIEVITEGKIKLLLTSYNGEILQVLQPDTNLKKGIYSFKSTVQNKNKNLYVQLIQNDKLVHFQEY